MRITMSIEKMVMQAVFLLISALAWGQFKCDLQNVSGVATIRGDRIYLAVWRHTDPVEQMNILDIYAGLQCTDASRVAHFEDRETPWQSLSAIEDFAVLGFRVRTTAGDNWFGSTKVFMYDGKQFRKSFDSGEIAEVIDLVGDGYPQILEFLGDTRRPAGKVRVWVWRKGQFKLLTTVTASELYSAKLSSLIRKAGSIRGDVK
jgi:hypothetical protein